MIRATVVLMSAVLTGNPHAQVPEELHAADSVRLRVLAVQELVSGYGPGEAPPRIWIVPYTEEDSATGEERRVALSSAEWTGISEAFPQARMASSTDSLYVCEEGVQPVLPGDGCSIAENGIIVRLSPLAFEGDSVRTWGERIQGRRSSIWGERFGLVFRYVNGTWEYIRTWISIIT